MARFGPVYTFLQFKDRAEFWCCSCDVWHHHSPSAGWRAPHCGQARTCDEYVLADPITIGRGQDELKADDELRDLVKKLNRVEYAMFKHLSAALDFVKAAKCARDEHDVYQ